MSRDHYQEITDRIVAALEGGDVAPWQRPWKASSLGGVPRNAATGRPYRGINVWLTLMTQWERGYDHPLWLSFKQANEFAGRAMRRAGRKVEQNKRGRWVFADGEDKGKTCGGIRAGQNKDNGCGGTDVIFWKPMKGREPQDDGTHREFSWLLMRSYNVFNIAQCDQHVVDFVCGEVAPEDAFQPLAAAERICEGYEIQTVHGGDRAFYRPATDTIHLPRREAFHSPEHYYTTRFHEMGHSTGAASRLSRDGIAKFDYQGSHQYAEEELVAEFTACFLAGEAGIVRTVEGNAAGYLRHWAAKLREDPKIVVLAAQRAQKAADLILGRSAHKAESEAA